MFSHMRLHVPTWAAAQKLRPCTHRHVHFGLSFHQMKVSPLHSFPQILDNLTCIWGKPTHQHVKRGRSWDILWCLDYKTHFHVTLRGRRFVFSVQIVTKRRGLCTLSLWLMIHRELLEVAVDAQHVCAPSWQVVGQLSCETHFLFCPLLQTIWKINCISLLSTQKKNSWLKTSKTDWKTMSAGPTWSSYNWKAEISL